MSEPPPHLTVRVPATSANLGPGYDAFGLALGQHLVVRSGPRASQAERVLATGEDAAELPTTDDNLVWRSLVAFCDHVREPVPDVALRVASTIPLERGLGSSSAAIVAGLVLARALTSTVMGDRELVAVASRLEGHPDNVAPALLGGLVACVVDDDGELVVRRINPAPQLRAVVFVPRERQSTTLARGVVAEQLSCADVADQAARAGHVLAALAGLWPAAPGAVGDRLHEPNRLAAMGPSGELIKQLRRRGVHTWLSGAGPTVAAVVGPDIRVGSRAALDELRALGHDLAFELRTPTFDLVGALACPDGGCALAGGDDCVQCPRRRV